MKIGLLTDSLPQMSFEAMLAACAALKIPCVEFGCGNWSPAPHLDLDALLESEPARREFTAKLDAHGVSISALNCSGNPLFPGAEGQRQHTVTLKTFRLAKLLGVDRIVMMSGLPGGPGDANPNWIVTEWPPECRTILKYQWDECVIPYWRGLVDVAKANGVARICLELHGAQAVYNPRTLTRLRNAVGGIVGANYDPSHPLWMGADPLAAIRALGDAIYYVHAKDTRIEPIPAGIDGVLETAPADQVAARGWNYVTLGFGHGEQWWREFCATLRMVGYDDVLSIEHEDSLIDPLEGVRKSVELLRNVAFIPA
ncbi:MAG TPA: sugar phosphate isomerase/epimerase [Dongiaceae bacterium]|jgi:sugar phosphate isomerase/epimerase|nr:sugar phosphate isomerase/epimerase [Dongiaceae bacterium]